MTKTSFNWELKYKKLSKYQGFDFTKNLENMEWKFEKKNIGMTWTN